MYDWLRRRLGLQMKIIDVQTHVCHARMRNRVFVKVVTDQSGLHGWGEGHVRMAHAGRSGRDRRPEDLDHRPRPAPDRAPLAEATRISLAPHNPQGPVSTAASLQLGFAEPSYVICERVHADVPWRADVVREGFTVDTRTAPCASGKPRDSASSWTRGKSRSIRSKRRASRGSSIETVR